MRNVTKDNITEVFMGYLSQDTDPRMREIMGVTGQPPARLRP